jgi:uncharacterized protein (DUF302 family)
MAKNENQLKAHGNKKNIVISGIIGLVVGVIVCAISVFVMMPSMMIVTEECSLSFDETVSVLKKNIVENGWVVSTITDMNKSMAKHGVEFAPRVKLIKLCKPEYAKSVLETDRHISTMMPCTFSVWEGDDGKVYLSKMNMGLMAKMFGGNVAKVMGGDVVREEEKMLLGLLKK